MKRASEITFFQELGNDKNSEQILEFLEILSEKHKTHPSIQNLKALLENPPDQDTKLQTIYKTPFVSGDIVLAGTDTRKKHPLTHFHPIHFKKSYLQKLSRWETSPTHEALQSQHIWEHFQESSHNACTPMPLGASSLTYRSQLLTAKSLGSISPVSHPFSLAQTPQQILHAKKHNENIQTIWAGLEELNNAIDTLHCGGFLHHDLHRENLLLQLHSNKTPTPHIIDFETSEEDDRFQTPEWASTCQEDKKLFLQEAALILLCLPKEPKQSPLLSLVKTTLQINTTVKAVHDALKKLEKQQEKSLT
jgi:hypothetical protein